MSCTAANIDVEESIQEKDDIIPSGEIYIVPPGNEPSSDLVDERQASVPIFVLRESPVILSPGRDAAWDRAGIHPGAVVYHDGLFHMFYNGHPERGFFEVGYAVSIDGLVWNRLRDEPILRHSAVDAAMTSMAASSVLIEADGTWVLYLWLWSLDVYGQMLRSGFYRATAPEALGPWSSDGEMILEVGESGDWDSGWIAHPEVVQTPQGYRLYFTGVNNLGEPAIGLATSADGLHWQKYNDPLTNTRRTTHSDPVFDVQGSNVWDAAGVQFPRLAWTGEGWGMLYIGLGFDGIVRWAPKLGYATSPDGIHWQRLGPDPIFDLDFDLPRYDTFGIEWLPLEAGHLLFFNRSLDSLTTEILIAVSEDNGG